MSNRKRVAERNAGVFIGPGMFVPAPVSADNVGPGKAGPGDEWNMPTGPLETEEDEILEPVHANATVVLPRRPTRKG